MKKYAYILTVLLFMLTSCTVVDEQTIEIETTQESKEEVLLTEESNKTNDSVNVRMRLEQFATEVLQDKKRLTLYNPTDSNLPRHMSIFQSEGLTNILAYSNKDYPKNSAPDYYEHFTVFALEYECPEKANAVFDELRMKATLDSEEIDKLPEASRKEAEFISMSAKPGGMICTKEKFVFSLVETCRNTPVGGSWIEYEDRFISHLTDPNESMIVLNADCGQMSYREQERKTVHNNL